MVPPKKIFFIHKTCIQTAAIFFHNNKHTQISCIFEEKKHGNLHAVLLLELKIFLVEGVDTINHGLDKLDLGVAQAMLVGNVVGVSSLATRFTTGATGLDGELFAPLLEGFETFLGPSGQVNVDRGSHASSQVGWAGVDVAELGGEQEVLAALSLDRVTDSLDAAVIEKT